MATLAALATRFHAQERPAGNLLGDVDTLAQAIAAASFYAGWGEIQSRVVVPPAAVPVLSGTTEISESEWSIIRPLFMLYVERESALQQEASRVLGMDVFGRASSEVASSIEQKELEIPGLAFCRVITTV